MDTIHFVAKDAALCGAADARWCTILRETVTCAECRRRLRERDSSSDARCELPSHSTFR
jgi:hypothetical protein